MQPGNIVRFRERDWILLPSPDESVYALRPLMGTDDSPLLVHRELTNLLGYTLPEERLRPSRFPPPSPEDVSDAASAHLLWQAARLTLRDGAAPIRCLGRISIRPRVYQFVPLLMALRLDPVRLFIADDVGVGKTIEALLVARELWDRREISRFAVLAPPYLCDQWQQEIQEKFNLEAVVIRPSTIGRLERSVPPHRNLYQHYPIQVISIDWVKSDRNRYTFLEFCPELVIVDEAHGAAQSTVRNKSQQQRHSLLQAIAQDSSRHLILLTATPHSGVEDAFRSLLGLLRPEFRDWDMGALNETQRKELARHFVQRTRQDIERDWEHEHCFPQRISLDVTYNLSPAYRQLFDRTYAFATEIVRAGEALDERRRRVRYWGALALLRCVMSSPAAAVAALEKRIGDAPEPGDEEADYRPFVFEDAADLTDDEAPIPPIEAAEETLPPSERRLLRRLRNLAAQILDTPDDTKLHRCLQTVDELLNEGFHPILWCRYVATAEYLGQALQKSLSKDVQVVVITGRMGDEERRMRIDEIDGERPRVLVATDCLSEGINLQEKFTAALHYDLPWNPNRLEQREGRVDRYGQTARQVKAVRFYGVDNPVDGAVIEVLLDKAREIYRALGTYVPVPQESETIMEAVFNSLFRRRTHAQQLSLFEEPELAAFHKRWDLDARRERINRTQFAQRALKPEVVRRELEAVDAVLGDPGAVEAFVLDAARRVGLDIRPAPRQPDPPNPKVYLVHLAPEALAALPEAIRFALPNPPDPSKKGGEPVWRISFASPTPAGAAYVGRNHRFVQALAAYLLEEALVRGRDAVLSRCGVIRTQAVDQLTGLLLLRVRYLIRLPRQAPLLAEEVQILACRPLTAEPGDPDFFLDKDTALTLLVRAIPQGNIPRAEKQELLDLVFQELGLDAIETGKNGAHPFWAAVQERLQERARELADSHRRIRQAVHLRVRELRVEPQLPPDLLGVLLLQPTLSH